MQLIISRTFPIFDYLWLFDQGSILKKIYSRILQIGPLHLQAQAKTSLIKIVSKNRQAPEKSSYPPT